MNIRVGDLFVIENKHTLVAFQLGLIVRKDNHKFIINWYTKNGISKGYFYTRTELKYNCDNLDSWKYYPRKNNED